ncbi:autophagy-related protein 23 isoform X4 [Cephus cinctus]|uniref:Autophagy-related protein 23 isoform X4 n=1 Tax=Cephus cinctus TaxID=211228 RepID=A0AAJ7FJ99_CEPCN|nr:autophagy-related protein 23 isoform X4 [Cephus cinctus]
MPGSQAAAASERRNDRMTTHEPPKLKTTLKTPPKQATNPLQFVKVGPCSLYRTAQEQLQKVQEVKKIKQEVRDDPEDWQSNLDNWKSSRRKRQEHIIERVVEVKKLELEEHDRQRRRSKTFSEMMEERGNRGRKMSISLAMYQEEDANDLSDLGIGTSSGKSSVSGDTHDDAHSVLSDRDSEIEKNHSDVDNNGTGENGNAVPNKKVADLDNGFHSHKHNHNHNHNHNQEYDSATTATASSPEPEEYTYEGAIRGYVSRVSQNIPMRRKSLANLDAKLNNSSVNSNDTGSKTSLNDEKNLPVVKVDIVKRREIFEKASQKNSDTKAKRLSGDFSNTKSIKERLSHLESQREDGENGGDKSNANSSSNKILKRLSGDMSSIRERLSNLEKQTSERESQSHHQASQKLEIAENSIRKPRAEELSDTGRPLRDRLMSLEKYTSTEKPFLVTPVAPPASEAAPKTCELSARSIKDRLNALDSSRKKDLDKRAMAKHILSFRDTETRIETSTPSERSSSPDSEYRIPRTAFHRSLDSLDADASSGPDTFERVQSLEELDYSRRYPASSSSAELLNDTDREDSGIHTADVSCSVSQADEPVDEDIGVHTAGSSIPERQEPLARRPEEPTPTNEPFKPAELAAAEPLSTALSTALSSYATEPEAVVTKKESIVTENSIDKIIDSGRPMDQDDHKNPRVNSEKQRLSEQPEEKLKVLEDPLLVSTKNSAKSSFTDRTVKVSFGSNSSSTFGTTVNYPSALSTVSKQILPLNLSGDGGEEIVTGLSFTLGQPTSIEPPKEKPPPPPVDLSDEETVPVEPLKRLNSTRRIKKELRTRRSDFLGIEGVNDEELERELTLTKPPDMAAILAEERRIEQLHRRSYDTDSNYEQDSCHERDSGVELGHAEEWNNKAVSPDMSQHSRQSSEPFGASVTSSEEDEITKKEREIIEVLEKEEQWRYGNNHEENSDLGEKLAHKLRELEEEKMQLERERAQEVELRRQEDTFRKNEENIRKQEGTSLKRAQQEEVTRHQEMVRVEAEREAEARRVEEEKQEELRMQAERMRVRKEIEEKERRAAELRRHEDARVKSMGSQIREQENDTLTGVCSSNHEEDYASGEVLRVERELLQLEQEELKRQRNNLVYRDQKKQQLAEHLEEQWKSLQDVAHVANSAANNVQQYKEVQVSPANYRSSMPNLQFQDGQRRRPPPPPIPPAKPLRLIEQRQRDVTIRNSRVPSADSIPHQVDTSLRQSASSGTLANYPGQQMSRQTLQALSAAPRPRIVQGDQWVQRRKSDVPRATQDFNYQHWLIQEAEQRRINEKNQRSPRKPQVHVTGTSVPYTGSPPRSDSKPLPDSIIQTLTQRVQNRVQEKPLPPRRRLELSASQEHIPAVQHETQQRAIQQQKAQQPTTVPSNTAESQEKMLSVSGKKKCSHCGDELGRGAAMIIESLRLFYHMECFKCCVCHVRLGDGLMGTDVRVRNHKLHCHNCYSSDDGVKFSCV